jgi:hypothetical protein
MANKKPEESPKARKARLEEERTSRRPAKKAVDKKEVKKAAGKDAARAAAVSANKIPSSAPKPAPKKKAAKSSPTTPADRVTKLTPDDNVVDTTKGGYDPAYKEIYDKSRKARELSEIGQGKAKDDLTPEQTAAFVANREEENRRRGIGEIPFSSVPKNEVSIDRKLTPRMTPVPLPTPSQEARTKSGGPSAMGIGTGNFTFNNPEKPPMRGPNVAKRSARRLKAGLEGHPGDQPIEGVTGTVNSLAVKLAARDHALAKETGRPVGGLTAEHMPPTNESIQGSHHQRLATIIMAGVKEENIDKLGSGTGRTREAKVSHLFEAYKQHRAHEDVQPVDLEAEGITHVIHPETKQAIPVSSMSAEDRAGVKRTVGKPTLVSQNPETAEWRLEGKTGNRQVDSTLGWDPDKAIGYVQPDSHPAGTKSLVMNMPPKGRKMKTLWEHHVQTMNSDFPAPVEGDIMRRHDTPATRIVDADTGQDVPNNRLGDLVRSNRTGSKGKIVGALRSSGRTTRRWKAAPDGTVQPDVRTITSRARITDESAPPTHATPGYASMYSPSGKIQPTPGGSTRITRTAEVPEVKLMATYKKPEVRQKKYTTDPVTGEKVMQPYKRGMVLIKGESAAQKAEYAKVDRVSRQFTPRDITTDEGRGAGPSDQALPGFESYGKAPEAPAPAPTQTIAEAPKPVSSFKEAGIGRVPSSTVTAEGPIEAWAMAKQISYGKEKPIKGSYTTESGTQPFPQGPSYLPGDGGAMSDARAGRDFGINFGSVRIDNPAIKVRMPKTAEIAKIPGNSPVEVPREEPQAPAPKAKKPKDPQPAIPGFKDYGAVSHKDGAQWIKAKDLSPATKALQAKKDTKGSPNSGKLPVPRGFSVINTRSNKQR